MCFFYFLFLKEFCIIHLLCFEIRVNIGDHRNFMFELKFIGLWHVSIHTGSVSLEVPSRESLSHPVSCLLRFIGNVQFPSDMNLNRSGFIARSIVSSALRFTHCVILGNLLIFSHL